MIFDFHRIPPCPDAQPEEPHAIHMVVETPRGTGNKFAYKHEYGMFELSRIMRSGMRWPCDFGFVPQTLGGDGDPLDVTLLIDEPTFPGCLVKARLLGVIGLVKNGEVNDRLVACPVSKKGSGSVWDAVRDLGDVSSRFLHELEAFLRDYNTFDGNVIELTGYRDAEAAMHAVRVAHLQWKHRQNQV